MITSLRSDFYSADNQILLMFIPLWQATFLPSAEPGINPNSELEGITLLDHPSHPLVAVKAGTTNEQFRRWCLANKSVCLPLNVIMVEITFGGSNAPICHGAGLSTATLSDLVAEVQYVDANGELQTVSDPKELKAAAGCFGLLGPVIQLTLRVDKMQMALMSPVKLKTVLAIPPPDGYPIPKEVDMTGITPQMLQQAKEDFVRRCETSYYLEWFWFPYQKVVWVNTWDSKSERIFHNRPFFTFVYIGREVAITRNLGPYPSSFETLLQWVCLPFLMLSPRSSLLNSLSARRPPPSNHHFLGSLAKDSWTPPGLPFWSFGDHRPPRSTGSEQSNQDVC